jgi:hypothetical protein
MHQKVKIVRLEGFLALWEVQNEVIPPVLSERQTEE